MKVSAASTIPTSTAKVRSVTTVKVNVNNHTAMSSELSFRISVISSQSPMLYATIIKIAAKADNGTFFTSGAANRTIASSVNAWIIPATGVLAPERTLVAVRAMAPVAGSPPNSGDTIFATPCAMSSTFGLCLSLLMRSETTADINDSIAPSMATVNAGESNWRKTSYCSLGTANEGSPLGIPPNRVPMVSIGKWRRVTAAVAPKVTIIAPGTRFAYFRQAIMMASDTSERMVAGQEMVFQACANAFMRWKKSPGTWSIRNPKKSRICVLAMRMAIPFVKPTMTGRGKYLTAVPMPVTPSKTRRTPAIMVQVKSPSMPYFATIPETTTTNAPVGPPICVFDPPSAEIKNPVTMAQ